MRWGRPPLPWVSVFFLIPPRARACTRTHVRTLTRVRPPTHTRLKLCPKTGRVGTSAHLAFPPKVAHKSRTLLPTSRKSSQGCRTVPQVFAWVYRVRGSCGIHGRHAGLCLLVSRFTGLGCTAIVSVEAARSLEFACARSVRLSPSLKTLKQKTKQKQALHNSTLKLPFWIVRYSKQKLVTRSSVLEGRGIPLRYSGACGGGRVAGSATAKAKASHESLTTRCMAHDVKLALADLALSLPKFFYFCVLINPCPIAHPLFVFW